MDTLYLSSELPRLPLASEADLRRAAEEGLLEETHYLDLKREAKPGKGENRELARDLSSFAIDSGSLLIGVDEGDAGVVELVPQPLAGLAERIEQVAAMIPDPPVAVIARVIRSEADSAQGYVVVHVPASPLAPHMVDGRYLGRGDKTKRYLTDAEVLMLHGRRRLDETSAGALLDAEIARDPVPSQIRQLAHLFVLAEPLASRPDAMANLTDANDWQQRLRDFAFTHGNVSAVHKDLGAEGGFSPDLSDLTSFDRRPNGLALTSYGLAEGRLLRTDSYRPETVAELEIADNGGIRMFCGRLSDTPGPEVSQVTGGAQILFDIAPIIYARRTIALAVGVAEAAGYFGNWALGLAGTGLRGTFSYQRARNPFSARGAPYGEDIYRRTTVAGYADLANTPRTVADRLVGPLLRALGTKQTFATALVDPKPQEDTGTQQDGSA